MGTIQIDGSTPKITVGNATAEDATILFDGNAQDFYIALDDSADDLLIGLGSTVGTTPMLSFTEAKAAAFTGAVTMASTLGVTGVVTGAGFTAGSAVLAEAELELLDGLTAGTAIASKVVTTDANIDTTGQRNLTISGEIDAATGDFSGAVDVAGTTTAVAITASGLITANADMLIGGTTPTLTIGDAGAEDAKIVFDGNAQDFHIGLDDSSDDLVIGLGSALGTTSHIVCDEAGQVTKPLQPYFHVSPTSSQDDIANGDTIVWGSEVKDVGANFASNTFTAPVTGVYVMSALINTGDYDSSADYVWLKLETSNRTHKLFIQGTGLDSDSYHFLGGTAIVDMDASDTATIVWEQSGGASQANIVATNAHWYGYLLG